MTHFEKIKLYALNSLSPILIFAYYLPVTCIHAYFANMVYLIFSTDTLLF